MSRNEITRSVANAFEADYARDVSATGRARAAGVEPPANAAALDAKYGGRVAALGAAIGLERLGVAAMLVEPGKRAFPFHNHLANDELFVILEGEGTYRFGDKEYPVKAGDLCGAPHGGPETAHQLINTGAATLRYLSISTMIDPEIAEYPENGKFAAFGMVETADGAAPHLRFFGRRETSVDYFDGEA